jgi:hypothetical protein
VLSEELVLLTLVGFGKIHITIFTHIYTYQLYNILHKHMVSLVHCDYDLIVLNLFNYVLTANL